MIKIKKGLRLPISGEPSGAVDDGAAVRSVALLGADYVGMKPTLAVDVGDTVSLGQLLFTDKKTAGVRYTSPGAGRVAAIHRGAKRRFESIVIDLDNDSEQRDSEQGDAGKEFRSFSNADLTTLSRDDVRDNLVDSGLWTAFRTRPYSKVPAIDSVPHSIFVTAIDTNPLSAPMETVLNELEADSITHGLQVIRHLTDGQIHLCQQAGAAVLGDGIEGVTSTAFDGPHPAGLPGTHIHFLDPVSERKTVWHVDIQDVAAIGKLFVTGRLDVRRIISVAGPAVRTPKIIRTRLGANLSNVTQYLLESGENRIISGSVLSGRTAASPVDFLGRYHHQVSVLQEGTEREFLGWQRPGFKQFSIKQIFASAFFDRDRSFAMTTSTNGSERAMVPVGSYEAVMPLDVIPTFLLRALIVGDTEQAKQLGCLELSEEDLALCTFVCPGKYEYSSLLRSCLEMIEKEG